jgi:hypothetical protein
MGVIFSDGTGCPGSPYDEIKPDQLEFQGHNYNACRDYLHDIIAESFDELIEMEKEYEKIREDNENLKNVRDIDEITVNIKDDFIEELLNEMEVLENQVDGLLDYLEADKGVINMATRLQRNKTIVSAIRNGETFRNVAAKVGVHHRTAQRVADAHGVFSARSWAAEPGDFTRKGLKVYNTQNPALKG